jgi:hypothetical protein
LSKSKIFVAIELSNEEMTDGPRRQFLVPKSLATSLKFGDGDLIEIFTGRGSPLRAWARLGDGGENIVISASSLEILGVAPGDHVSVRAARPHPETFA